jgi:hypothetical protein
LGEWGLVFFVEQFRRFQRNQQPTAGQSAMKLQALIQFFDVAAAMNARVVREFFGAFFVVFHIATPRIWMASASTATVVFCAFSFRLSKTSR